MLEPHSQFSKTGTGATVSTSSPPDISTLGEGDDSKLCPPADADHERETFGLQAVDSTWTYRRGFVSCNCGSACNDARFRPISDEGKNLPERRCSLASTHKAWWLGSQPGWYAMRIPLPECLPNPKNGESLSAKCRRHVTILGGLENCVAKIEPLRIEVKTSTEGIPHCNLTKSTKDIAALVEFDLPDTWPTYEDEVQALPQPTGTVCNYADQTLGSWKGSPAVWTLPGCEVASTEEKSKTKVSTAKGMSGLMCTIGDSHFQRTVSAAKKIANNEFGFTTYPIVGDGNNFLNGSAYRQKLLMKNLKECTKQHQHYNGKKNAVVLSVGSHWTTSSTKDMIEFAAKLADTARKSGECVLLTAALDSCHENIPDKFPVLQRVWRNSWRASAQVRALGGKTPG